MIRDGADEQGLPTPRDRSTTNAAFLLPPAC